MKLRRLNIERLPGIDAPFEIEIAGDGFHVVHGPNGIGKSSICRAVEALFWADEPIRRVSLTGWFELGEDRWRCERDGGKIQWQLNGSDSPPPSLPSSHLRRYFFLKLRDLIDPKTSTKDIAGEIQKQMSGGFDLPGIVSDLFGNVKPNTAQKAKNKFQSKLDELSAVRNKQDRLQNEADQMVTLEARLERAERDERRLTHVETAIKLARRRSELGELSRRISALPKSLEKLIGDEKNRLDNLRAALEEKKTQLIGLSQELEQATREKTESALATPIEQTGLAAWRTRSNDLQRTELELKNLKQEHSGACGKLDASLKAVGRGDVKEVEFNLEDHHRIFEFLRKAQTHKTRTTAIEERLRLLADIKSSDQSRKNTDQFNDGVNALRVWLRTPAGGSTNNSPTHRRFWLIGAVLLIAGGTALAVTVHPGLALVAGVGGGIILALLMWRSNHSDPNGHRRAEDDFEKLGLDGPEVWDLPSVEARLRELERQIAEHEAKTVRSRDRNVEVQGLESQLEGPSEKIEESRQSLLKSLKLEKISGDAELVDMARALDHLREARIDKQRVAGEVENCEKEYNSLLSDLSDALESHGQTKADNAAATSAGIYLLIKQDDQLRTALSDEKRLLGDIERINGEIAKVEGEINEIFCGLDLKRNDHSGLATLIELRPDFLELIKERTGLETLNKAAHQELSNTGEETLARMDKTGLDGLVSELSVSADSVSTLRDEIAAVKADVKNARKAHDIENLIEEKDAALARLEETFDRELFERAGRLLVHDVEQEHEQIQMPRVLKRARKLFSAFTHNSYDIQLDPDVDDTRLIAVELRTKNKRELAELSGGARSQLLLASRLAFAEEVERGNLLPLFLDEALDQSDPLRYREIVKSLGLIVKDQGRQIFYFTNDPVDLERIQTALAEEGFAKARSTDLGRVRNRAESIAEKSALYIVPRTPVPDPADYPSAEDYAVAIDVRPLDPRRGPDNQHLFHLLWDDLNLLHALLKAGVEWVGKWRKFSVSPLAANLKTKNSSSPDLDLRTDLFIIFCELWNQGRGQPVYSDAIEDSGAISGRFLSDVIAIAADKHADGERLIQTLRAKNDPRLKGFREKNTNSLEQYFRENGYIDNRPVLSEDQLRLNAMASPAAARLPDGTPGQCIDRWSAMATRANAL